MNLIESQVSLTDTEQVALGTDLNPVPAGAIGNVWRTAMYEATGLADCLRDAANEETHVVDGGLFVAPVIIRGQAAQQYESVCKRIKTLNGMAHSAIAISMETI